MKRYLIIVSVLACTGANIAKIGHRSPERLQRPTPRAATGAQADAKVPRPAQWHKDDQTK
jgi:hypothetical protein